MGNDDLKKVVKDDQLEKLEKSFKGSNSVRPPTPTSQANSNSNNEKKEK